jgi:membrane-bound inhibitor of C-type lysozyme
MKHRSFWALIGLSVLLATPAAQATRMTDPYYFRCDDGAEFSVAYVAEPVIAWLTYEDKAYELKPERTASGTRYVAVDAEGGEVSFWNKGEEALFEMPGQPLRKCRRV